MHLIGVVDNNFITVIFRSHLTPSVDIEGFELGKRIQIHLADNTSLEKFIQELFYNNKEHIGFVALNEILAKKDLTLSEGDSIYVYSQISGG